MLLLPVILWWAREPMRFAVGRWRRVLCVLVIVTIAVAVPHRLLGENRSNDDSQTSTTGLIREGALIPPTSGKIVVLGRRWAFVPESPLQPSTSQANQLTLAENLCLQRIVEAIRSDALDDQWIISGEVSEFFGENRMTIKTAQRSNIR